MHPVLYDVDIRHELACSCTCDEIESEISQKIDLTKLVMIRLFCEIPSRNPY